MKDTQKAKTSASKEILLSDIDWRWATWRKIPPLPLPKETAFDRDAVLARIAKAKPVTYGWEWDFAKSELSPSMSKDEARLFLECMLEIDKEVPPKKKVEALAKKKLAPVTLKGVMK